MSNHVPPTDLRPTMNKYHEGKMKRIKRNSQRERERETKKKGNTRKEKWLKSTHP